jgi:hypothetical protein
MNAAFEVGFQIDRQVMNDVLARSNSSMVRHMRNHQRGGRVPGQSDEVGWVIESFDQLGWKKDDLSTDMAAFLSGYKSDQDYWQCNRSHPGRELKSGAIGPEEDVVIL